MANLLCTFISIKPEVMQCGPVDKIVENFQQKRFCLMTMTFLQASEEYLMQHCVDLKDSPFFLGLEKYMDSGLLWPWSGSG